MARGRSSDPPEPGTPQGLLEETATSRYEPIQRFFEEVARRSGREASTEKSAFYRYTRRGGRLSNFRVAIYEELLGLRPDEMVAAKPARVRDDEIASLRAELAEVRGMVAQLLDQRTDPAQPARKARRRSA